MKRYSIHCQGVVQGVGFRPFIYQLAHEHSLTGSVCNRSDGVHIEIEGPLEQVQRFITNLPQRKPPLASISSINWQEKTPLGTTEFSIVPSSSNSGKARFLPPDTATCSDCLRELQSQDDRRFNYPFINCTNCGPRFTIAKNLPYDRVSTTMASFALCQSCSQEYHDPADRRFHAQPVACPECGPQVYLHDNQAIRGKQAMNSVIASLNEGNIIALKGLGGIHLICLPSNKQAIVRLRQIKQRQHKPFALMAKDMAVIKRYCQVSASAEKLLTSSQAPIVIMPKADNPPRDLLYQLIAPNINELGFMLPYSPLHYLLFTADIETLIVTSANLKHGPVEYDFESSWLKSIESKLDHNRPIHMPVDDSVVRIGQNMSMLIRRARGYVPLPIKLPLALTTPVLAVGGDRKCVLALAQDECAYLSPHIGNMSSLGSWQRFEQYLTHYQDMFALKPKAVVCDLHPSYLTSQWAEQQPLPVIKVQHHQAHAASCLGENALLDNKVLCLSFDGTGYGEDNTIWGGEFFYYERFRFKRVAHFKAFPLWGGEQAIRQPWRVALALAMAADLPLDTIAMPQQIPIIGLPAIQTSSLGRLFDGVASILGLCHENTYTGQAAILLEQMANKSIRADPYPYKILSADCQQIDWRPMIRALVHDVLQGVPTATISSRFHITIADMSVTTIVKLKERYATNIVCCSGGVFQNMYLNTLLCQQLNNQKIQVYFNKQVPTNDAGLSYGQLVLASLDVSWDASMTEALKEHHNVHWHSS